MKWKDEYKIREIEKRNPSPFYFLSINLPADAVQSLLYQALYLTTLDKVMVVTVENMRGGIDLVDLVRCEEFIEIVFWEDNRRFLFWI